MEFDEQTRQVIAQAIRERRAVLGLSQEQAAAGSGGMISTANLRVFEGAGRATFRQKSLVGVARAMSWPADAIARIARGEDPRSLPTTAGAATDEATTRPAAGGVQLATTADIAHLQRQLDELRQQVSFMSEARSGSGATVRAAHSGDLADGTPAGPRRGTRSKVEGFTPDE